MKSCRWSALAACIVIGLATAGARADDPPAIGTQKSLPKADPLDASELAAKIDALLSARWQAAKVTPAPKADDAEFVRRVYLDVVGRIPTVAETRTFLNDQRPEKRKLLIEELLKNPGYINHWSNYWRSAWMPEANTNFISRFLMPTFDGWLRQELMKNAPYDKMVRAVLTTPISNDGARFFNPQMQGDPNPLAFFVTKELKPENMAASTARMFLGVRLECAQCHDHPFASWQREQFWNLAAFFAGLQKQEQQGIVLPQREQIDRRELTLPNSEKVIQARFLDGKEPEFKSSISSRVTLADWLTAAENPYFARAAVNRIWAQFFGVGLVEPVDDMLGSETTGHNPELLDLLAAQFIAHQYDLKFLIRVITESNAYQLSSAMTDKGQEDSHLFARMSLKGLTPEQLFDSLVRATGFVEARRRPGYDPEAIINDMSPRTRIIGKFDNRNDKPTEAQTSILQALALMNGKFIADATAIERSETLAAVVDAPFLSKQERIETLYLATLCRLPRADELDRVTRFLQKAEARGKGPTHEQALADVFWALLNSSEFILNH